LGVIPAERLLVCVPNWIGDVAMATPALVAIRRNYPAARIMHLLRPYVAEVLAGSKLADENILWPPPRTGEAAFTSRWGLVRRLCSQRFDLAVLLTNSFKSAAIAWLAGARRRVGYTRDARHWLLTDRLPPKRSGRGFIPIPAMDYYNDLARYLGCRDVGDRLILATTPADEAAIDERLGSLDACQPLVVLNPGANYGPAKCWPAEKYARLSDKLVDRYGARVVASLVPNERDIAERLASSARRPIQIFVDPPLGIGPLKALVRRSRLLVTNDTGPRHFAAAFGVPVVTVFGSSDPAWTDTRFAGERIAKLELDCQPCMERVCPLRHHNCMGQLEPDLVLEKIDELLARPGMLSQVVA